MTEAETTTRRVCKFVRDCFRGTAPVFIAFAASRALVFGIICLSKLVIVRGKFWQPGGLLTVLTQWDGQYYLRIARSGYYATAHTRTDVAFFPAYPHLVRITALVFHDYRLAAVITANLCLLVAVILLFHLVTIDFGTEVGRRTVMLLLFSPVSFFFSSSYTESTFLMFAVAAFYAATKQRWGIACICGILLSATRNVGLLIAAGLFVEHLRQSWDRSAPLAAFFHRRTLLIALVPSGLALYMLYSYIKVHDFLAFAHAGATWGRVLASPIATLSRVRLYEPFYAWLLFGSLMCGFAVWTLGVFLRLRPAYLVWAALLLGAYSCSNTLEAMPRYLSVVFPLFIALAVAVTRTRGTYEPLLALSVAALTLCTILSANGYWMT